MKIFAVAIALISAISASTLKSLEGNMNYISQQNKINSALKKGDGETDNHLA